jgi:hypothetical protein
MTLPAQPAGPTLTPTQRLAFDANGFALLENVLSPAEIAAVNGKLDPIEAIGVQSRDSMPDAPGIQHESRYERLGATWPQEGEAARAGIGHGDSGAKIWSYGAVQVAPSLPMLAAAAVCGPQILPYVNEFHDEPFLQMMAPRFQWQNAESDIHDSRSAYSPGFQRTLKASEEDMKGAPMNGMPKPETDFHTTAEGRLKMNQFRVMLMLTDIEAGGGALMVIPGSHKRSVPWNPDIPADKWTHSGNARYSDLKREDKNLFVEITGKAGTAVLFTHDIIHHSWHETDTYRRVIHLIFGNGNKTPEGPQWTGNNRQWGEAFAMAPEGSWLQYLLRGTEPPEPEAAARL